VQLTAARFNKMHGAPRILHMSLILLWELSANAWKGTKTT